MSRDSQTVVAIPQDPILPPLVPQFDDFASIELEIIYACAKAELAERMSLEEASKIAARIALRFKKRAG